MKKLYAKEIPKDVPEVKALQEKGFERGEPIYRRIDRETGEECYLQLEEGEQKPWWLYAPAEKGKPRRVGLSQADAEELPEHLRAPGDPDGVA